MKPGQLFQTKFQEEARFCRITADNKIDNDSFWNERVLIIGDNVLMHVETLAYSEATVTAIWTLAATATATATAMGTAMETATAMVMGMAMAMEAAERETFVKTKKISGDVFLTPLGIKIWISKFDQNNMR